MPVVLAPAVAAWLRRRIMRPGAELPACARCAYIVFGLPTSICPECGTDLYVVGTRRPTFWVRLSPRWRMIILLLGWSAWAWGGWYVIWQPVRWYVAPVEWSIVEWLVLEPTGQDTVFATIDRRFRGDSTLNAGPPTLLSQVRLISWSIAIGPGRHHAGLGGPCACEEFKMQGPSRLMPFDVMVKCQLHNRWGTAKLPEPMRFEIAPLLLSHMTDWLRAIEAESGRPRLAEEVQWTFDSVIEAPLGLMQLRMSFPIGRSSIPLRSRGSQVSLNERWAAISRWMGVLCGLWGSVVIVRRWRRLERAHS